MKNPHKTLNFGNHALKLLSMLVTTVTHGIVMSRCKMYAQGREKLGAIFFRQERQGKTVGSSEFVYFYTDDSNM